MIELGKIQKLQIVRKTPIGVYLNTKNDKSSPKHIKAELNMSKAAFKRAVGRLLKQGAIKITDDGQRCKDETVKTL